MERRDRNLRDECHDLKALAVSRRAALGSSGLALWGLLSGPALGQDQGQGRDNSEHDAAIEARLKQRKAFAERMHNAGSMEERMKMMEEIRAMDRQRAIDGFQRQLGLSDQQWTVVKPRVETVYNLVHPQPRSRANSKKTEVDQRSAELRELLEKRETPADRIKTQLAALRRAKAKANQELARARQNLQQLMSLRQEAVLVLAGLLE